MGRPLIELYEAARIPTDCCYCLIGPRLPEWWRWRTRVSNGSTQLKPSAYYIGSCRPATNWTEEDATSRAEAGGSTQPGRQLAMFAFAVFNAST